MLVPSRFKAAINSAVQTVRSKWYLVIPFVFWELSKDRLASWANDKIDKSASTIMKEVARLLEWVADQPLFWTLIVVVIILLIVFLHAYITDGKPKIGIMPDEKIKNINQVQEKKSEVLAGFLFSSDEMIKRLVDSDADLNKWKQDYQEWNTNVTNSIRNNISHTQAYHFSNPGMMVVRQFDGAYNDEHNSLLNSLAVQRENLRYLHSLES